MQKRGSNYLKGENNSRSLAEAAPIKWGVLKDAKPIHLNEKSFDRCMKIFAKLNQKVNMFY